MAQGRAEGSEHYGVIARAIAILDAAGPGLRRDALAARLGISEAQFERSFAAWVGVSPGRCEQYLVPDQARRMLAARAPMLDAALAAGLSDGARRHDAVPRCETITAGTPCARARAGAGLTIRCGVADTPFGPAVAMATDRGLCGLGFAAETGVEATAADLRGRWPGAAHVADRAAVAPLVAAAFGGGAMPLHLIGARFQIRVWEALLRIPAGAVATYAEVAAAAGAPLAVRAAGTAVGRNPLGFLIPCHLVLRKSGALGGYRWGLPIKRAMLAWEAARAEAAAGRVAMS